MQIFLHKGQRVELSNNKEVILAKDAVLYESDLTNITHIHNIQTIFGRFHCIANSILIKKPPMSGNFYELPIRKVP